MPTLKLNDEGQLVTEDGTVFELEGEPVVIEGAKTQGDIDKTVNERLARERAKFEDLKKVAEREPILQKQVEESAATIKRLEQQAEEIEATIKSESQAQLTKLREEANNYKSQAEQMKNELVQFQVKTSILGLSQNQFNDPATDLVPHLLAVHKREAVRGDDGKPTGEFKDFFKLPVKSESGEITSEFMPLEKAIEVWAESHPHHVKPSGQSGSGGGNYTPGTSNLKRSEMSRQQKIEFVSKHGNKAFESLPA